MAEEKKVKAVPAKAVTAVKKDDTKLTFFKRIGKWFRDMKSELKKVVWPTGKELTNNTLVSLGMMIASGLIIWFFDWLAKFIVTGLLSWAA